MRILARAYAAGWVLIAASAAAQAAKPDAETAAAAAMERAKRQAAGPMRIILQASKPRRKGAEGEAAAVAEPAARAAPVRAASAASAPAVTSDTRLLVATAASGAAAPSAARAPMESEAAPAQLQAQQPAQQPAQTAGAPPVAAPPVAAPPVAAPPVEPPSPVTLSSEFLQARTLSAAVPSLDATATAPIAGAAAMLRPALPQATVLSARSPPAAALKPRLTTMVEPDLPQRLLDQLGRNATVLVDLKLRADGSVAGVTVLPPSPRQLDRVLAAALEQWKFDPLPADRVHRVELVFNPER